ncbi:MAG: aldo/keto reductase [Clostridia bacterium]|nr:aldo/keto reductase [Clostridia bacterium]
MIFRKFKDLDISALGMGCMRFPTHGEDNQVDMEKTAEMVDLAMKSGVNYYDTAWGYHGGESEKVMGELLSKYPRDSFYLATKFPGYTTDNIKPGKPEEIFPRQLEKCKTDYFDFYLFHNVSEYNIDAYMDPANGILEYLLERKAEGKIRHLGFSTHGNLDTMRRFLSGYGEYMEFCQIQLNWLDYSLQNAKEKLELLREFDMPVIVMEPVRGGRLANLTDEYANKLRSAAPDRTAAEWAFRFLQGFDNVFVTLSGMSNMDQLRENIATYEKEAPLTDSELKVLFGVAEDMMAKKTLSCTGCKYCLDYCPNGLNIPELIKIYNKHLFRGGSTIPSDMLGDIDTDKRPDACIACGSCESVCPQGIKISEIMGEFSEKIR